MTLYNGSDVLSSKPGTANIGASPRSNLYETPDAYILALDMPGAVKDQIAVSLDKDVLVVEADIHGVFPEGGTILRNEIRGTRYERSFVIGQGIQRDSVDARFENGVLTLKLFKAEDVKPKEISIK